MIEALLKGKLSREQENMEDILTSNVFGLLRLLPPADGLLPFLRDAKLLDNSQPLELLADDAEVDYDFWPRFDEADCHPCEPDVVLRITNPGRTPHLVWVEAKYLSGKSSEESPDDDRPYDQLAREWDNLVHAARREHAEPLLIYLTTDISLPEHEIEASQRAYQRFRGADALFACAWLSWRDLPTVLAGCNHLAARHLIKLADRLEFHYFRGISGIRPVENSIYRFAPALQQFDWSIDAERAIEWGFVS